MFYILYYIFSLAQRINKHDAPYNILLINYEAGIVAIIVKILYYNILV